MKNKNHSYYSFRIKLEKLKQKTLIFVIISRILFFLVTIAYCYLRRT